MLNPRIPWWVYLSATVVLTAPHMYAGRLLDRLRKHFGDAEGFVDLEAIEPGAEFGKVIVEKARAAEVLVATAEDAELRGGKTGVVVMSTGRYCFDDFVVRNATTAR